MSSQPQTQEKAVIDIQNDEAYKKHKKQFYDALDKHIKAEEQVTDSEARASAEADVDGITLKQREYYPKALYDKMIAAIENFSEY